MIIGELCTFPHFPSLQYSKHHILLLLLPKIIERGVFTPCFEKNKGNICYIYLQHNFFFETKNSAITIDLANNPWL